MIKIDKYLKNIQENKFKILLGFLISMVLLVIILVMAFSFKSNSEEYAEINDSKEKNKIASKTIISSTTKVTTETTLEETTTVAMTTQQTTSNVSTKAPTVEQTTKVTSATISPTTVAPTTVTPPTTVAPTTVVQTTEVSTAKTYYYNGRDVSELEYKIQTNPLNENAPAGSTLTWGTNEWGFCYILIMPQFSVHETFYEMDNVYVVKETYKGTTVIDAFYYWFIVYSDNSYVVKLKPENSYNTNHK